MAIDPTIGTLERRLVIRDAELRDYERSMENANRSIRELKDKLAAVERENRDKCTELAEKAFEIRELRGVVDAAAAFVNGSSVHSGEAFDELRKRLDALDLPDDAPRPENHAGYVVWHRLDGDTVRLWPIPKKVEVLNPALRLEVNFSEPGLPAVRQEIHCEGQPVERCESACERPAQIPKEEADAQPVPPPQAVVDLMAALKASLEISHTGAPGNSVDTRVERDPEP